MKKMLFVLAGAGAALGASLSSARAADLPEPAPERRLSLQFSPNATLHYTYDSAHRPVLMVGLERESMADGAVDGAALFTNSFGQPTIYVYPWGRAYHGIYGIDRLSFKWTAGLMYGYRDPYQNKVPLNHQGFSPVAVPALAYDLGQGWAGQLNFLGTAALMVQVNRAWR